MNPTEANWLNLFDTYSPSGTTWHALTTAYSLGLAVTRSYKFKRRFATNDDKSIIYHTNTYYQAEGQEQEQSWQFDRQEYSQSDGVVHPAAQKMRTIGFSNETSIWLSPQFDPNNNFGFEAFFLANDTRYSMIVGYQIRDLARFAMIKEHKTEFPEAVNDEKITDLIKTGSLQRITMTPDLQTSTEELTNQNLDLSSTPEGNENYFLPEQMYLNLPGTIIKDQAFSIAIGKQTTSDRYKQITIKYDQAGKLAELVSEVYDSTT